MIEVPNDNVCTPYDIDEATGGAVAKVLQLSSKLLFVRRAMAHLQ